MRKIFLLFLIMFSFFKISSANSSSLAYDYEFTTIDGNIIKLKDFKQKVIVVVNVASRCGYTPQYESLQKLYADNQDQLNILAFPSNDFLKQEPGTNEEIKTFCDTKYNVSFPLFDKVEVKGDNASPLFKFLEDQSGREIQWNFSKFLINKDGEFVKGFGTQKTPEMIEDSIKEIL